MAAEQKPVAATIELLARGKDDGEIKATEEILEALWIERQIGRMIEQWHGRLEGAAIAVAWKHNWSEDRQGNTPVGAMKLVPELFWRLLDATTGRQFVIAGLDATTGRQFVIAGPAGPVTPDFVMLLNSKLWKLLKEKQKQYIIDELLCYASDRENASGDQAADDTGRTLWRLLKPQFTGFAAPVRRHGPQMKQIAAFLKDARRGHQEELDFGEFEVAAPPAAPRAATDPDNGVRYYRQVRDRDDTKAVLRFRGPLMRPDELDGVHVLTVSDQGDSIHPVVDREALSYEEDQAVLDAWGEMLALEQESKVAAAPRGLQPAGEGGQDDAGTDLPHGSSAFGMLRAGVEEGGAIVQRSQDEGDEGDEGEAVVTLPTNPRGRGRRAAAAGVH